jgi:hypothetical protein
LSSAPDVTATAERGVAVITVPAFVREQVQVELMTLETLTSTVAWFLERVARSGPSDAQIDLFFDDEASVWES